MKKRLLLLGMVLPVLLCACKSVKPDAYRTELEDSVKGELAVAQFVFEKSGLPVNKSVLMAGSFLLKMGCPQLSILADRLEGLKCDEDNLGNKISKMHDSHGLSYARTFASLAADTAMPYAEYAALLREIYDNMEIELSEPELIRRTPSTRQWRLRENISGVEFKAEVSGLDGSRPVFSCVPEPESLQRYIDMFGKIRVETPSQEETPAEENGGLVDMLLDKIGITGN